ncbi:MAG TPA: exoribonuclease II [Succinivibrionaceae bacterium]|nr:exoribonuclease II [Succinivibrionaceae bacterium]
MLFNDPALSALKQQFVKEKIKKEGVVKGTDRGFGFLEADRESYFISPDDMRNIMHGDRIQAYIESDDQGRQRAKPIKLVDNFLKRFIARTIISQGKLSVLPDHPNIHIRITAKDLRQDQSVPLTSSDWVVCNLTAHALKNGRFEAEIIERICAKDDPQTPWIVSLRRYDLPLCEPADREFKFLESNLPRIDLTQIPFVTIDSAHTEDMDDALYIEKTEQGFKLKVAIADPTGYIDEQSDLDAYAAQRGFSIYLPGKDIPMLPRILSQDLCSLRENQPRPALVGSFFVSNDGTIDFSQSHFELATIKSHGKLIYNEVSDYLEHKENSAFTPSPEVEKVLLDLVDFTRARDKYRATYAATFRNKPDYDFILNAEGALDHIEVNHRRIANQIVEESMITANVCAGQLLAEKLNCGIFNTHAGFDKKKIAELKDLLESEHCPYKEEDLDTIAGYNRIRRFALSSDNNYMDSRIRKLQEYSQITIAPAPHFALGVENYATWTSPIRKYGDMINHRLLKSIAVGTTHPKLPDDNTLFMMNTARRTNRMAERDVRDWLYVDYLEPEIDKRTIFQGEVFDISRGGMRVTLDDNGAMIFIPFSFMSPDKDSLTLDGEHGIALKGTETVLKLGDPIKVKIVAVDKENRSVTGAPAESIGGVLLPDPYAKKDLPRRPSFRQNSNRRNDDSGRNRRLDHHKDHRFSKR